MAVGRLVWVSLAVIAFLLPVAHFGELGVWTFVQPVSNLDWDEAQRGPHAGARSAGGAMVGRDEAAPAPYPPTLPMLAASSLIVGLVTCIRPR